MRDAMQRWCLMRRRLRSTATTTLSDDADSNNSVESASLAHVASLLPVKRTKTIPLVADDATLSFGGGSNSDDDESDSEPAFPPSGAKTRVGPLPRREDLAFDIPPIEDDKTADDRFVVYDRDQFNRFRDMDAAAFANTYRPPTYGDSRATYVNWVRYELTQQRRLDEHPVYRQAQMVAAYAGMRLQELVATPSIEPTRRPRPSFVGHETSLLNQLTRPRGSVPLPEPPEGRAPDTAAALAKITEELDAVRAALATNTTLLESHSTEMDKLTKKIEKDVEAVLEDTGEWEDLDDILAEINEIVASAPSSPPRTTREQGTVPSTPVAPTSPKGQRRPTAPRGRPPVRQIATDSTRRTALKYVGAKYLLNHLKKLKVHMSAAPPDLGDVAENPALYAIDPDEKEPIADEEGLPGAPEPEPKRDEPDDEEVQRLKRLSERIAVQVRHYQLLESKRAYERRLEADRRQDAFNATVGFTGSIFKHPDWYAHQQLARDMVRQRFPQTLRACTIESFEESTSCATIFALLTAALFDRGFFVAAKRPQRASDYGRYRDGVMYAMQQLRFAYMDGRTHTVEMNYSDVAEFRDAARARAPECSSSLSYGTTPYRTSSSSYSGAEESASALRRTLLRSPYFEPLIGPQARRSPYGYQHISFGRGGV